MLAAWGWASCSSSTRPCRASRGRSSVKSAIASSRGKNGKTVFESRRDRVVGVWVHGGVRRWSGAWRRRRNIAAAGRQSEVHLRARCPGMHDAGPFTGRHGQDGFPPDGANDGGLHGAISLAHALGGDCGSARLSAGADVRQASIHAEGWILLPASNPSCAPFQMYFESRLSVVPGG